MPFDQDGEESPRDESSVYDSPSAFNPYDPPVTPEAVQPTSPSPARSSEQAPGFGDTSGADGKQESDPPQESQEQQKEIPLPEFDRKYREPFEGLLYLGRLQETFTLWGHTFTIRTLTTEQLAEIGLLTGPYEGTDVKHAVYQAAVVAGCVMSVDGKPLPDSIEIDNSQVLTLVRFPYVKKNWLPPVIEGIYARCFALEITVRQVLDAMGKASG